MQSWIDQISALIPHGMCLSSSPFAVWLNALGNLSIAFVYVAIPLRLWFLLGSIPGRAFVFSPVLKLFGAFILLCGLTHLIDVMTLFVGGFMYIAQDTLLFVTAIVSFCALTALVTAHELGSKLVSVFVDRETDIGSQQ